MVVWPGLKFVGLVGDKGEGSGRESGNEERYQLAMGGLMTESVGQKRLQVHWLLFVLLFVFIIAQGGGGFGYQCWQYM